jgi:hypothetical protein
MANYCRAGIKSLRGTATLLIYELNLSSSTWGK